MLRGPVDCEWVQLVTHHWVHDAEDDGDPWSEPIGPGHIRWQNCLRLDFVEVARGPHSGDIVGNGNVVVEPQHSSISAEDIEAREAYYGNMVWLFDATQRFVFSVNLGSRSFFSLGKTKHLELCKKPVFLDFGFDMVQVDQFTNAITMSSGYGVVRSREWFANAFSSSACSARNQGGHPIRLPKSVDRLRGTRKVRVGKLKHETKWIDPGTGEVA